VIETQKADSVRLRRPPNSTAIGSASTLHDIDATMPDPPRASVPNLIAPRSSRFWPTIIGLALVIGGASAMAGYLITHRDDHGSVPPAAHDAAGPVTAVTTTPDAAPMIATVEIDAAVPHIEDAAVAAVVAVVAVGSGSDGSVGSAAVDSAGSAGLAGSDNTEIEMDPEKAEDLDPAKGSAETAEDEAGDAPKSNEEAEHAPTPAAPQLATNIHDAVLLIQAGKREEAIASLRMLQKKQTKSAYIPFLLGSLYFDKTWWSVSMDNYAQAIHVNPEYKNNGVISRNLIKMLASAKTRGRASGFLRGMGHPAVAYVKYAAAHDPNPVVKKYAAGLAKQIR